MRIDYNLILNKIEQYVPDYYCPAEYPALYSQLREWERTRPLQGVKILEGTPIFRNTLTKYRSLLAAGAELTIAVSKFLPYDQEIVNLLDSWGMPLSFEDYTNGDYDVVLDCAGRHAKNPARMGYVELTRSGLEKYLDASKPVFLADAGRIKEIETGLGTGDGCLRGLAHFGYSDLRDKKVVLFGFGKVGRGIALRLCAQGALVTVVEQREVTIPECVTGLVTLAQREQVSALLAQADFVISATGIKDALELAGLTEELKKSPAVLVNMGAEDEYGDQMAPERVLFNKHSLNFALEEPTFLRYIDPTMALDNYGALLLKEGLLPAGTLSEPTVELEEKILNQVRDAQVITAELEKYFS